MLTSLAASIVSAFAVWQPHRSTCGRRWWCLVLLPSLGGGADTYDACLTLDVNGRWTAVQNLGRSVSGGKSITISGSLRTYPSRVLAHYSYGGYVWPGWTVLRASRSLSSLGTAYLTR
jgi:hypothetical protein